MAKERHRTLPEAHRRGCISFKKEKDRRRITASLRPKKCKPITVIDELQNGMNTVRLQTRPQKRLYDVSILDGYIPKYIYTQILQ
ncbi:hypothetical protein AYI68_g4737 [Smittium mucronatum]|uniref:Uncharacterized protein n=1 Tax=Smittium mucronatum TaxID=133383 RepID=A0A1R0GW84_9FUNG|nr:hypothetical protein AYI68_g4737 [Smittium mucronatum]